MRNKEGSPVGEAKNALRGEEVHKKVKAYLEALNQTDVAHEKFIKNVRSAKKDAATKDESYKAAWKERKKSAEDLFRAFSQEEKDFLLKADAGRKAGRERLEKILDEQLILSTEKAPPKIIEGDLFEKQSVTSGNSPARTEAGWGGRVKAWAGRILRSPWMKGAVAAMGLATLLQEAQGKLAEIEEGERVREEMLQDVYENIKRPLTEEGETFHVTTDATTIEFADGVQKTVGELAKKVNTTFTEELEKKNGPVSLLKKTCATEDGDLDMFKVHTLYGDQYPIVNGKGIALLEELYDLSPEELRVHGEVMRDSVYHRPPAISLGAGSLVGMAPHDSFAASDFDDERELYRGYYAEVSFVTRLVLQEERGEGEGYEMDIKMLKRFGQEYVEFENTALGFVRSLENANNPHTRDFLFEGIEGEAKLDAMLRERDELSLAIKGIVSLEEDPQGSVHQWAEQMQTDIEKKIENALSVAMQISKYEEDKERMRRVQLTKNENEGNNEKEDG